MLILELAKQCAGWHGNHGDSCTSIRSIIYVLMIAEDLIMRVCADVYVNVDIVVDFDVDVDIDFNFNIDVDVDFDVDIMLLLTLMLKGMASDEDRKKREKRHRLAVLNVCSALLAALKSMPPLREGGGGGSTSPPRHNIDLPWVTVTRCVQWSCFRS